MHRWVDEPAANTETGAIGLMIAMAVAAFLTILVGTVFQVSQYNQSYTAFHREQGLALDAAEGGLDLTVAEINQASQLSSLPCGSDAVAKTFSTSPVTSSAQVSVWYYDVYPAPGPSDPNYSSEKLVCSGSGPSGTPASAMVLAQGQAGRSPVVGQYMEAELQLGATAASSYLSYALYSASSFSFVNKTTIVGDGSYDANVYSGGPVSCGNGVTIQGGVNAQGNFTGSNNCTVDGDVNALGDVSLSNSATIGGNASAYAPSGTSCGSESPAQSLGYVFLANSSSVDQSAYAYCQVSTSNNATVVHQEVGGDTSLEALPSVQLPSFPEPTGTNDQGAQTAWQNAGYAFASPSCTTAAIDAAIAAATRATVLIPSCSSPCNTPISWSGASVSVPANIAIFSNCGFTMSNNTSWQSANSSTQDLYFFVPSSVSGTATTCSGGSYTGSPGITLQNKTAFASSVNVLFYTPCTVSVSNNSTGYGQIYAGQISASNYFTANYVPIPVVSTSSSGGSTWSSIWMVYERQVASLPAL